MNQKETTEYKLHQTVYDSLNKSYACGTYESSERLAKEIMTQFLVIDRDEMPETNIIERFNGEKHIDVKDAEAGTWPLKTSRAGMTRKWGLEYLAAAEVMANYVPEPEPVTIPVPGNCIVSSSGVPVQTFRQPGLYTYTPKPGAYLTITIDK